MVKKSTKLYSRKIEGAVPVYDRNFQKIIKFFLFECPVAGRSVSGQKFEDYSIKGQSAYSTLKKKMLCVPTDSLRNNYKPCKKEELPTQLESMKNIIPTDEYCVFLKHDEKLVMQSLYSAIRNALAHGSFSKKRYAGITTYYLYNYDGYLKAEMILHEKTLLGWIDCVKSFNNH